MKAAMKDSLMKTDFVRNCKMMYTDTIDNMQDALKNSKRQYERHIKSLTNLMEPHAKKLVDLNL